MQNTSSATSDATVQIIDEGDERKYYTQIPNIIFTLGLSPFELTLYCYLKKVAGASGGKCWQKTATLAKATNMGDGSVSRAKAELSKPRAELNGKSLIVIDEEANRHGGKRHHVIRLTNIWLENVALFEREHPTSPREIPISTKRRPISTVEIASSTVESGISTVEIKKNPPEEKPLEEKPTHDDAPAARTSPPSSCASKFKREDLVRYARNHPELRNPKGWATTAEETGRWDEEVADWFKQQGVEPESSIVSIEQTPTPADTSRCPDCRGLGFIYPNQDDPNSGVRKCHHPKLRSKAA